MTPKNWVFALITISLFSQFTFAQNIDNEIVEWQNNPSVAKDPEIIGKQILKPFWCIDCNEKIKGDFIIPVITKKIKLNNKTIKNVSLSSVSTQTLAQHKISDYITNNFDISVALSIENSQRYALISISGLRKASGGIEALTGYKLLLSYGDDVPETENFHSKKDETYNSVLETGDFYKLAMPSEGVYKITADFLTSNGIDLSDKTFSKLAIFGNGGKMLPEIIAAVTTEDLQQIPCEIIDVNGNNSFDADDYVLFYSGGHNSIDYNTATQRYDFTSHDFDTKSYVFLTWSAGSTMNLTSQGNGSGLTPSNTFTTYDYVLTHESEEENLIHSGRRWWGDKLQHTTSKNFSYNIPGLVSGGQLKFSVLTGVNALENTIIQFTLNGNQLISIGHSDVTGVFTDPFLDSVIPRFKTTTTPGENLSLDYTFLKTRTESKAWLDYFTITAERKLGAFDDQQPIQSSLINGTGIYKLSFDDLTADHLIWDVSDAQNPKAQEVFADGSKTSFTVNNAIGRNLKYHLFKLSAVQNPEFISAVENQNYHGYSNVEYFIITREDLLSEAERLAEFHRSYSGLTVEVVEAEKIYNEFSSGSQDVTGIRNFLKLMYDRGLAGTTPLKYVCMFGDASYDYKDILENNTNVVPIYQSYNSYVPAASYCSDDYYAILDDNEGYWGIQNQDEGLDIGVGRLPASNLEEAKIIVDKIYHYHSPESFGDWINRLTFVGDDEDGNAHVGPSEEITDLLYAQSPVYNINKIWLDAYEQVSFGSGNKYPQVNADINKAINSQGTLIFNYVGHGGENGMAHERVVTRPEITSWTNKNELSFYITASCELAKIDNLEIESPGELMLLNPNGGAIGMVATTRVVYIGANTDLNTEIMDQNLFEVGDNKLQSLGNTYMNTRNAAIEEVNKRCFLLIADPAMSLLSAPNKVVTTKINGQSVANFSDTLKALSLVSYEGEVRNQNNALLTDFNGTVYPTLYDKFSTYQTRGNDPKSKVIEFELQNGVVYKGKVSVVNGKFSFQFVVPKDISYNIGYGKMSYYAHDDNTHAAGSEDTIKIGGTASGLAVDNTPPTVELFINDNSWVFGGITDNTPLMYAELFDENGLNTIGSGIGREMEAILDAGTDQEQSFIVNDFYTPAINSYQAGVIEFPFSELPAGKHTLKLKVWDVYNNSSEGYTEFTVSEDEDLEIQNLLNYPNPFNNFTTFHFDHNKAGQNLTTTVTISTVAGNIVKTITTDIPMANTHSADITWDGKDEYGDMIARGVYIYNLKIKAEDGSVQNKLQKLFIVN